MSKSVKSTHFETSLNFITGGGAGGGAQAKYNHFQETCFNKNHTFSRTLKGEISVKRALIL